VTIFVRHDGEQFIIAPMQMTPSGICYEQSDTRVIRNPTAEELGLAFQRAFEASYCRIFCESVNSANVTVCARTEHPRIPHVDLSVSFNPKVSQLAGQRILLLVETLAALRGEPGAIS
jgi:hypothetical protein